MNIQPRSGTTDILFSPVQRRVLGLLLGQPGRRFQSAELIRLVGGGTGATHRQLVGLTAAGILTATHLGNQKFYEANTGSPIFGELRGIITKTSGLVEPLRQALHSVSAEILAAFVYGSIAKGTDHAASDVDLMVLSDHLTYADVYEAVHAAEQLLARRINPTVMTSEQWHIKRGIHDSFVGRVAEGPKLFIVGREHDIA